MSHWGFVAPWLRAWRASWNRTLDKPLSRLQAWVDMLILDHGLFRFFYANRFKVSDRVERQNHPTPLGVARAARRGIRTIINLRGETDIGSFALSEEACRKHGIKLVNFKVFSRKAPSPETIHGAARLFKEVEYPILIHCKSGADRAGLMSALYLILEEGKPVAEARKQLRWFYGHVRQTNTGVLDTFLETYEAADGQHRKGDPAAAPLPFLTWVDEQYDPVAVREAFRVGRWGSLLDWLMNRE